MCVWNQRLCFILYCTAHHRDCWLCLVTCSHNESSILLMLKWPDLIISIYIYKRYWFVCILSAHTTREKCEVPFFQGFASNSSHHLSHTYSRDLCGVGGPVGLHAPFGARTAKKANIESNIIKNNLQLHIKKEIFPSNCLYLCHSHLVSTTNQNWKKRVTIHLLV